MGIRLVFQGNDLLVVMLSLAYIARDHGLGVWDEFMGAFNHPRHVFLKRPNRR
jgi:hypothetical protein